MAIRLSLALLSAAALFAAAPVAAQLLGGGLGGAVGGLGNEVGSLGGGIGRTISGIPGGVISATSPAQAAQRHALVGGAFDRIDHLANSVADTADSLVDLRRLRLSLLVEAHRTELDRDGAGNPVRRDRLIAVDPDPASLSAATAAGFRVLADDHEDQLGLRLVSLSVPARMNPRKALDALHRSAPSLNADFDHIYEPAGGALAPSMARLANGTAPRGTRIAMIDGGVASHPSMAGASIEQKGFAGPASATGHGTAVASLLVGDQGAFRGAARGASLFVGDVYGGNPASGSALTIVRAMGWAASKNPQLINISLVGPANRVIERAIGALRSRGIMIVAAIGNDGPAAPPQYPASYPGVVAVTGVDAKGKALVEAGRATHIDFAAPGADLAAALPGSGYARIRGTSFAAPLVAARLAANGSPDRLAGEARPGKGKVGRGIVCGECRIDPRSVGAK
ncbi:S8 family serine peptidase [Sphingomonas sp.]|uniref:S8 family serine peptidase n=1 Tax=Sphingomonas sp. TaxID=28214 RepID=UPI00286B017B|nr:S8 family serine peptidase [Sphingomonas sp.]